MRVRIHYHDLVLIGIIVSLLIGAVIGWASPVPTTFSVPVMAAVAILIIYHTIFRRGPVETTEDLSKEVTEVELLE